MLFVWGNLHRLTVLSFAFRSDSLGLLCVLNVLQARTGPINTDISKDQ